MRNREYIQNGSGHGGQKKNNHLHIIFVTFLYAYESRTKHRVTWDRISGFTQYKQNPNKQKTNFPSSPPFQLALQAHIERTFQTRGPQVEVVGCIVQSDIAGDNCTAS